MIDFYVSYFFSLKHVQYHVAWANGRIIEECKCKVTYVPITFTYLHIATVIIFVTFFSSVVTKTKTTAKMKN